MSDPFNLSLHVNLEFLRKEAKALLKQCRVQDAAAIARIRAQLPRVDEIKLADVQHALAREQGYMNWAELKRNADAGRETADFSKAGSDGDELPSDFSKWRRVLSCTIRPDMLSPLVAAREYRMSVIVTQRIANGAEFAAYGDLYRQAREIAATRISELELADAQTALQQWIISHAWWWNDPSSEYLRQRSPFDVAAASVAIGLRCGESGSAEPRGEDDPSDAQLMRPGGATPEEWGAKIYDRATAPQLDEMYGLFDSTDPSDPRRNIVTVSYGEYVPSCEDVDFEPFVRRAEHRAKVQFGERRIIRREWWCVTSPNMVCVDVYVLNH
jgi:hypothetical protein